MAEYIAECWQSGDAWNVRVRGLEGSGTARLISEVPDVACALVASATGRAPEPSALDFRMVSGSGAGAVEQGPGTSLEETATDVETLTVRNELAWGLAVQGVQMANLDTVVGRPAAWVGELAREVTAAAPRPAAPCAVAERPAGSGPDHYLHEAVFYSGDEDFVAQLLPFVEDGLRFGQPVMVAVVEQRLRLLREALGADAARVRLVDMGQVGANPARIIPAWRRFLDEEGRAGRPLRGIGEPIWAGRRSVELVECHFHEALLNIAVDADVPFWLRCPYDVAALPAAVLREAQHNHPVTAGVDAGTDGHYGGEPHIQRIFTADLPAPEAEPDVLLFDTDTLSAVRQYVIRRALVAGMDPVRVSDLALAVWEVARDSAGAGDGSGVLRVWRQQDAFVCEVSDGSPIADPLVGRRAPRPAALGTGGHRERDGAWLANQLCDLVQIRSPQNGAVVRIVSWV